MLGSPEIISVTKSPSGLPAECVCFLLVCRANGLTGWEATWTSLRAQDGAGCAAPEPSFLFLFFFLEGGTVYGLEPGA